MQIPNITAITTSSRHIFLSPHLDDAVYSCGGTLAVQVSNGLRPLVVTIFGGVPPQDLVLNPFAFETHKEMGVGSLNAAEVVNKRRQEDAGALDYLHVDYLWLDYLDAIYRGDPGYYTQRSQLIGGDVHPADTYIDRQLAQDLVTLHERLPDAVWYSPLAIGRHVDHQLVASAADRLVQRGANIKFYEDFPYVLEEGALAKRLQEVGEILEPAYVEMSEMLPRRQQAADLYVSQVQLNFGSQSHMHKAMADYTYSIRPVHTVHLERFWTPR